MLKEKYEFSEQEATDLADFLVPILDFAPEKRPTAAECLNHSWFTGGSRVVGTPCVPKVDDNGEKSKEKDEREAMEAGVGNIAIGGVSVSRPLSNTKQAS